MLTNIRCQNNSITDLDVSANTSLTSFFCENNNLGTLNVKNGNNANMSNGGFNALNNANLTCIQVDDEPYSTANWTNIDATASFNESCGLSVNEYTLNDVSVFPNPVSDVLNVSSLSTAIKSIEIFNQLGQLVLGNLNQDSINISRLSQGIYFCEIKGENGNFGRKRIIKN
ncbi:MAG: T9SS type A sorting domain-containing protein [Flavobacteriaceae bacterium]|nr:T9SS type A sorting domain-containing protein [Flavobacteriaceae bacterium]